MFIIIINSAFFQFISEESNFSIVTGPNMVRLTDCYITDHHTESIHCTLFSWIPTIRFTFVYWYRVIFIIVLLIYNLFDKVVLEQLCSENEIFSSAHSRSAQRICWRHIIPQFVTTSHFKINHKLSLYIYKNLARIFSEAWAPPGVANREVTSSFGKYAAEAYALEWWRHTLKQMNYLYLWKTNVWKVKVKQWNDIVSMG